VEEEEKDYLQSPEECKDESKPIFDVTGNFVASPTNTASTTCDVDEDDNYEIAMHIDSDDEACAEEDMEEQAFTYVNMAFSFAKKAVQAGLDMDAEDKEEEEEKGHTQYGWEETYEEVLDEMPDEVQEEVAQELAQELVQEHKEQEPAAVPAWHFRASVGTWLQPFVPKEPVQTAQVVEAAITAQEEVVPQTEPQQAEAVVEPAILDHAPLQRKMIVEGSKLAPVPLVPLASLEQVEKTMVEKAVAEMSPKSLSWAQRTRRMVAQRFCLGGRGGHGGRGSHGSTFPGDESQQVAAEGHGRCHPHGHVRAHVPVHVPEVFGRAYCSQGLPQGRFEKVDSDAQAALKLGLNPGLGAGARSMA